MLLYRLAGTGILHTKTSLPSVEKVKYKPSL